MTEKARINFLDLIADDAVHAVAAVVRQNISKAGDSVNVPAFVENDFLYALNEAIYPVIERFL